MAVSCAPHCLYCGCVCLATLAKGVQMKYSDAFARSQTSSWPVGSVARIVL